jgi:rsbT co-antagonist protein RsbR
MPVVQRYLELRPEERERLVDFSRRLEPGIEAVFDAVMAEILEAEELRDLTTDEQRLARLRPALRQYMDALREDRASSYLNDLMGRVRQRAEEGLPYETLVVAFMALERALARQIPIIYRGGTAIGHVRDALLRLGYIQQVATANAYLEGKEATIRAQQQAMLALSTPVVELWQGVLALPLVGTIDTGRARQITQRLLRTIRDTQARVVILDITGVPLVDTGVANHLMKTIAAARLLGARGIIVGISPEIADTLITLNIEFTGIETYFSLRQGLEAALSQLGMSVTGQDAVAS